MHQGVILFLYNGSRFAMKKSYRAERASGTAVYNLPASMTREIGRIVVHWAYFEYCVQEMNWQSRTGTNCTARATRLRAS
jgi:hypothetical protein